MIFFYKINTSFIKIPSSIRMARLPSGESPTHTILSRVANGNVSHLLLQENDKPVNLVRGHRNKSSSVTMKYGLIP